MKKAAAEAGPAGDGGAESATSTAATATADAGSAADGGTQPLIGMDALGLVARALVSANASAAPKDAKRAARNRRRKLRRRSKAAAEEAARAGARETRPADTPSAAVVESSEAAPALPSDAVGGADAVSSPSPPVAAPKVVSETPLVAAACAPPQAAEQAPERAEGVDEVRTEPDAEAPAVAVEAEAAAAPLRAEQVLAEQAATSLPPVIIGTATRAMGCFAKYSVYLLARDASDPDPVERRYSEFRALYKALRAAFPSTCPRGFPSKTWAFALREKVVEERRAGLQAFLERILAVPEIAECDLVDEFFTQPLRVQ